MPPYSRDICLPIETQKSVSDMAGLPRRLDGRPNVFLMTNTLEIGGSERQFVALAGAIHSERFQVQLGCLGRYGPLAEKIGTIHEFPLNGSFLTWQAWRSRLALRRLLRAKEIAVAHAFDFYTNLMLIPTARVARTPVVIGSHRQLGDLLTPMQFRAQAAAFRLCDRVVCNSRAAADRLAERSVPARKLVVIPNGLAPEAFAPATPAFPRSGETVRVGMIARMNGRYKNQAAFLRAAARVCQRCEDVEFVLVGDGPYRQEFERMTEDMGLISHVAFWGERQDIPAVLSSLDITVVPSVSESLPNVILESMAAGVPVVATRVGGIPEIIEDAKTGLLVPANDNMRMAEAIERLIREPSLRKEFGCRAKEYAIARFHWDSVSEQYEDLYTNLLAEKRRR
jgi:glycosyltransferase involved in cell wall biosynthesis